MDNPRVVRDLDGPGQSDQQLGGIPTGLRRPCKAAIERATVEQLERNKWSAIDLADLENLDDVGMMEPSHGLGLDPHAGQMIGVPSSRSLDHLDGNQAIEAPLPRPIDDAHTPFAQQIEEIISSDLRRAGICLAPDRSQAWNRTSSLVGIRGSAWSFRRARIHIGRDLTVVGGRLPIEPGRGCGLEFTAPRIIHRVGHTPGLIDDSRSPSGAAIRPCEHVKAALAQVGSFDLKQGFDRGLTRSARVHVRAELRLPGGIKLLIEELTKFVEHRADVEEHAGIPG
jgi:hypothetical protein